jgi:hypothetical protein
MAERPQTIPIYRRVLWDFTDIGRVTIEYPQFIGIEDVRDLEQLAALWLKGLRRSAITDLDVDGDWAE